MRLRFPILASALVLAAFGAPRASASPVRVGLLPVAVHSNESGTEYLSAGLASMLSSRLEQFDEIVVIRIEGAPAAALDAATTAGRDAGADYVVFGSFTQFGAGASLDLECVPTAEAAGEAGGPRRVFVQSSALGDIIPKLDDVAGKIHQYVTGGATAAAPASASANTGSLADLTRRVDALERAVFSSGHEEGPALPPPPKKPAR